MGNIELSQDQAKALHAILAWLDDPARDQVLTLGGFAGTGKTTLISLLVETLPNVAVAALCGKAAHVLTAKGVKAQTLHSLLYIPYTTAQHRVRFRKRDHLGDIQKIVVDEASMIDHLLLQDLLSYGLPVLFVGDHGQLEPIGTNPKLMVDPKLRLERIHRQALTNPILRLATAFREGRLVPKWSDPRGRLRIVPQYEFQGLVSSGAQLICGFNKTRHAVNSRIREIVGRRGTVTAGDRLICLRNNKTWGIFNGQQLTVLDVHREARTTIDLEVESDNGRSFTLPALKRQFGKNLLEDFRSQEVALLDFGYCVTAHKAQGSEWPYVVALEEIASKWDKRRWRYTVATRAKDRLVYCA